MKKGKQIAEGRTALIYEWGENKIIKIFKPEFSHDLARLEYERALASQKTGYNVPKVYEILDYEGSPAIIYQKVNGIEMTVEFQQNPWSIFKLSRTCARLHLEMHQRTTDEMPSQRELIIWKIKHAHHLNDENKAIVLKYFDTLPEDNKLTHNDFHPGNIMLTKEGPIIIDWIDGHSGHPLADVARSFVINTASEIPEDTPQRNLMKIGRWLYTNLYIYHYFKGSPYSRKDLDAWILPVAAARLSEDIPEEREYLVGLVQELILKHRK
jgi:aminoglycoside phosphotransferase (APT) family kinase protein